MGVGPSNERKPEEYRSPNPKSFSEYEEGQHWVTDPDGESTIHLAKEGVASEKPITLFNLFEQALLKRGGDPALCVEVPEQGRYTGKWTVWTWNNYWKDIQKFARSLVRIGTNRFESVSILGFNTPEWFIAHFGAIAVGGKGVGIYSTNGPEPCQYIIDHSDSTVVVVENEEQLAKIKEIYKRCPKLKAVVVYRPENEDGIKALGDEFDIDVFLWTDFLRYGAPSPEEQKKLHDEVQERMKLTKPSHACSLIYTSGTTGTPKAVMISHDNATWTAKSLLYNLDRIAEIEHLKAISYLPTSHIAAQLSDVYAPLLVASLGKNATVYFARPDALKGSLGETLKTVKPSMFFGVPRVWEKMAAKVQKVGEKTKGLKKKIVAWSKAKEKEAFENEQVGGTGKVPFGGGVAKKILSKVKEALGFTECVYFLTGAAPIQAQTLEYFGSLGIPILEIYGMSECCGPQTVSKSNYHKIGSCGPSLQGCEIKIDHDPSRDKPGEGEICYRGRHIMMGYMKNPEKTREAIDPQGWLHSGDVGRLDENGLLYITGRIKELIITAGAENIAPVPIEDRIKELCPAVADCMLIGDKRKFNSLLVTLKCKPDEKDPSVFTDELDDEALKVNPDITTNKQAMNDDKWKEYIQAGIDKYNEEAVSRAQRIQKFAILPNNFTVGGGELTPTMKLKRPIVVQKYDDVIESFYK